MSKTYLSVWVSHGDSEYPYEVWAGLYTQESKGQPGVQKCKAIVRAFKTLEHAEVLQRLLEGPGKKLKFHN